jgi:hypothetical protein
MTRGRESSVVNRNRARMHAMILRVKLRPVSHAVLDQKNGKKCLT